MARILANFLLITTTAILLLWGGRVTANGQHNHLRFVKSSVEKTIGVVSLDLSGYKKNSHLKFFNEDGSLWYQYSFYDDSDSHTTRADFKPFAFHPDYFLFVAKCVKQDTDRWEVIVNEETGLRKFVRIEDGNLRFETWPDHILRVFAVNFDKYANPMRSMPSDQGNSIYSGDKIIFRPVQIRGNWLRIRGESPDVKSRSGASSGWIKWRDEKNLIIEPFYIS